ncbi:MAG TPA: SAM-dependent methyltransferase [Lacipirellulaceae bacterium]|nr:SAM-dependent methyltransferase [Lacipirellulaceae bacterium]
MADASPKSPDNWRPQYMFAACQCGAEPALKRELAVGAPNLRLAYSRPGFVTLKLPAPCESPHTATLPSAFARTFGFSLATVRNDRMQSLVADVWAAAEVHTLFEHALPADVQVWQRDVLLPGEDDFEPGPTALAVAAEEMLRAAAPVPALQRASDSGHFSPRSRTACWPGGVPPVELPEHAVSRAYLKMAEALAWSDLPMSRGEHIVELGCAPGGASQALLDAGLLVTGVDPAEVDPAVLQHPRFNHVRARAAKAPKRLLDGAHWLAADMNVAPKYTLDVVESIVGRKKSAIQGMILTLKLADWSLVDSLPECIARVRSWGYRDVRLRQLAFNRREICLAALRSRSQRRVYRPPARAVRRDRAHASIPAPHHEAPPE